MLIPFHLSLLINLIFFTCSAYAGTPPRYPFDQPVFGEARCDNSLPNKPPENPKIKTAAKIKLESTGGGSGGRPQPIIPMDALEKARLTQILSSADPSPIGVNPTGLFQYWEEPFFYQVYTSEVTSNKVGTSDSATMEMVNEMASDVLRTCCQFGYSGTMFGRFSDNEGDYIEVYVSYWPLRPTNLTPLATEEEGPLGLPTRISSSPSRSVFRTSPGRMGRSPSQENLLAGYSSGLQSPSGSTELYTVPEDFPSGSGSGIVLEDLPSGSGSGDAAQGPDAPKPASQPPPAGTGDAAQADVTQAATIAASATINQVNNMQVPELQTLLRECRDAIVEMNEHGQTPEHTDTIGVELRETWCTTCCVPLSHFMNDHQGATGCCIMSMVGVSTLFTVLNFFLK